MGTIENPHGFGAVDLPIAGDYDQKAGNQSIAAHFDRLVKNPEVAPFNKYFDDTIITLLRGLNLPKDFKVVDIGCGNGKTLDRIRSEFSLNPKDLIGVDLSKEMVGIAKNNYPSSEFVVGDMRSALQDKEKIADVVISVNAIHYLSNLKDVREAYKTVLRLLKPGGWYILVTGDHAVTAGARDMTEKDIKKWIDDGRKPMDWSMPDENGKPVFRLKFYPYLNEEHESELNQSGFDSVKMYRSFPPNKELAELNKPVYDFLNSSPTFVFFVCRKPTAEDK